MGCASSTQKKACRNCQGRRYSPVRRSFSMHVHHPPQKSGDSYHLVSLTSTTLGSLDLDELIQSHCLDQSNAPNVEKIMAREEFEMGMIEAKTWSNMIDEKIPKIVPKTPVQTPPGEPESINAWEMMEGLDDITPLNHHHHHTPKHYRSFSFHVSSMDDHQETPRVKGNIDATSWLDLADSDSNTSIISEFDPEVIASFRKALDVALPPVNPVRLKAIDGEKGEKEEKEKLIVFFTSLRGVRKTYEDCCHVRVMLKGLGVKVDERDVSMHSGFKDELKGLLGGGDSCGGVGLPRVFLGKKYIGGIDEIRLLNEEGKLEKLVEGCELVDDGGGVGGNCNACGDIRFVPCQSCSGSCKIFYGDDEEEDEDDEKGFRRCPECNENGLVRCPICCD